MLPDPKPMKCRRAPQAASPCVPVRSWRSLALLTHRKRESVPHCHRLETTFGQKCCFTSMKRLASLVIIFFGIALAFSVHAQWKQITSANFDLIDSVNNIRDYVAKQHGDGALAV